MTAATVRVCAGCGAVSPHRRWYRRTSAHARKALQGSPPMRIEICRSCRQRRPGLPHGYLHVDGPFVHSHRGEIEGLIRSVADDAHRELPEALLLACEDDGSGGLLVTTSLGHVAARIGDALENAYDGQLHYGVVPGSGLAHVWWQGESKVASNAAPVAS